MNNTAENLPETTDQEVLIVVSKLKNYIRARSGMNTSGSVANQLTAIIRNACDKAIEKAQSEGRKTVMERDFEM